jgi:HSP20 family protein
MTTRFVPDVSSPDLMGQVRERWLGELASPRWVPPVDVRETDREWTFLFELAGLTEQDVEVEVRGDLLTVRGERGFGDEGRKEEFVCLERGHGVFLRSFKLDEPLTPENVEAKFDNGILTVVVPKAKATRPRKVSIRSADRVLGSANRASPA